MGPKNVLSPPPISSDCQMYHFFSKLLYKYVNSANNKRKPLFCCRKLFCYPRVSVSCDYFYSFFWVEWLPPKSSIPQIQLQIACRMHWGRAAITWKDALRGNYVIYRLSRRTNSSCKKDRKKKKKTDLSYDLFCCAIKGLPQKAKGYWNNNT